jgi:hypothetical protein
MCPYAARFGRPVGASANSQSPSFAEQRACDARLLGFALYEWMTCVLAHYSIRLFNKREGKPPFGGELAADPLQFLLLKGRDKIGSWPPLRRRLFGRRRVGKEIHLTRSRRSLPPRLPQGHGTPCDEPARGERLPRRAYSMRVRTTSSPRPVRCSVPGSRAPTGSRLTTPAPAIWPLKASARRSATSTSSGSAPRTPRAALTSSNCCAPATATTWSNDETIAGLRRWPPLDHRLALIPEPLWGAARPFGAPPLSTSWISPRQQTCYWR